MPLAPGAALAACRMHDRVSCPRARELTGTTTRDFTAMNALAEKYGDKLNILAFPCNQFGWFACSVVAVLEG